MGWTAFDSPHTVRAAPLACLLASLLALGPASPWASARALRRGAAPAITTIPTAGDYSVALEQCVGGGPQPERSATFVAQMVGTPATQKMAMKIDLEERLRGEADYRRVLAPGLGVWRAAETGVKIYKYVKQVTNLQSSASYRAVVHFRWIADRGRTLKRAEARSPRCFQPATPAPAQSGRASAAA